MFTNATKILLLAVPFLFLLIYYQVFSASYAYLDEIHLLWHNDNNSNFVMFQTEGRLLSGFLYQKVYSSISTIDQLRLVRIFSLLGWMVIAFAFAILYRRWCSILGFSQFMWWAGTLAVVCSLSTCICIGWAACIQVIPAILAGLFSGHILFKTLATQKDQVKVSYPVLSVVLVLGIISLFFYQNGFGIFLLPFFLYYLKSGKARPDRIIVSAVIFYLAIYVVYFLLFKYSLKTYHFAASDRTEIHFDILRKISFFFSGPLPQGFSMNLLFSASSIFSQTFYPLILVCWLVITFRRNKGYTVVGQLINIALIFLFLALIYLPSLIAKENFPPYRTLFVFNLAVFIMVIDSVSWLLRGERQLWVLGGVVSIWLVCTAFYAFNFQYVNPLKKEYKAFNRSMLDHYRPGLSKVYFIRADKFLFVPEFHTRVYRDEFGAPSTYRDWVPEPIVKQTIFEMTADRKLADSTVVVQFENAGQFQQSRVQIGPNDLVIDMNQVFDQ